MEYSYADEVDSYEHFMRLRGCPGLMFAVDLNPFGRHARLENKLRRLSTGITMHDVLNTHWLGILGRIRAQNGMDPGKLKFIRWIWVDELRRAHTSYFKKGHFMIRCTHCGGINAFV